MNKYVILFVMVLAGFSAQAQQKKNKNARYDVEVNGNCDQCKKRIEKASLRVDGVKMAIWDIESHRLALILNEEKTTVDAVEQAVAKVGHDTDRHRATEADYEGLHGCCKYERKPE
ncbi:MAG TPA: hypothetical protein VK183_06400 [Flavobacterium sp.]|nr:hypothetical protein [Flavobacterium sp.]